MCGFLTPAEGRAVCDAEFLCGVSDPGAARHGFDQIRPATGAGAKERKPPLTAWSTVGDGSIGSPSHDGMNAWEIMEEAAQEWLARRKKSNRKA